MLHAAARVAYRRNILERSVVECIVVVLIEYPGLACSNNCGDV